MRTRHLIAACLVAAAAFPLAAQRPNLDPLPLAPLAEKLGIRLMPSTPSELDPGRSATTALADPSQLAKFGIKDMHEGARVTVSYIGPSRIRVEVDEMEPGPRSASVTLSIAPTGTLAVVTPPGQKDPPRVPATTTCCNR